MSAGVWALRIASDMAGVVDLPGGVQRRKLLPVAPGDKYCGMNLLFSLESIAPLAIVHDSVLQKMRVAATTAIVALVAGLGTWLIAPSGSDHIGASGVVFGYAAYLIARGIFSRRLVHLALGLVVIAIYGTTLLFSVVPQDGISWQGHLFGAIGGVLASRVLTRPRHREDDARAALATR